MSEQIFPKEMDPMDSFRRGHMWRYLLARGFIHPMDRILDAACGAGYGSNILSSADNSVHVKGLDYDEKAIEYAKKTYTSPNIIFIKQDLDEWTPLPGEVDVAVSFETVEHLKKEPEIFIEKLKKASSRLIIFSAPIVSSKDKNPNHNHDLTEDQILNEFRKGGEWLLYESCHQRVYGVFVFVRKDKVKEVW